MVRRFLCLLLIPLMLANQGLCLGHVHRGSDSAEPEDHESRPHFHLSGHHDTTHDHQHSGHSHDEPADDSDEHDGPLAPAMSPFGSHDSDAVYCTTPWTGTREAKSAGVVLAKYVAVIAVDHLADHSDRLLRLGSVRGQPASVFDAACPIYLRTLSLRI